MSMHRVVVTGLGIVSPLGSDVEEFWTRLLSGEVGTSTITSFPTAAYRTDCGGEIRGFRLDDHCEWTGEPLPRAAALFLAAASQAVRDAGLTGEQALDGVDLERVAVAAGTVFATRPGVAGRDGAVAQHDSQSPQLLARAPARQFGFTGPNTVLSTGCAAGNDALGYGYERIRSGRVDAAVVGGADELSEVVFALFTALRALAPDVVRPFDAGRGGLMVAEGAGVLVLESAARARARGARVYAELAGQASAADAHHMTSPHPKGVGIMSATRRALDRAGICPEQVDYVSAHGTGTAANDPVEAAAIRTLFPSRPAVSSIKGALGHSQGAASAIEAIACALAIRHRVVPGSPTLRVVDPACEGVEYVRASRELDVSVAVNNAFGFGGSVSSVVLCRADEA
jgi:3-oxoacyl-(acyl-carrier-protein) synthase